MLKGIIISYSRLVNNWMLFLSLQVLSKRVPNICFKMGVVKASDTSYYQQLSSVLVDLLKWQASVYNLNASSFSKRPGHYVFSLYLVFKG